MISSMRFFTVLAFAAMTLGLAACGTVNGAGQDIENAGEAVQKSTH
jgi:predicted small secreted protein